MSDLPRWLASLPPDWVAGCGDEVFVEAYRAYESPGRFYHTWDHVTACVDTLRGFPCPSPRTVFLALLFHDAIYIPGSRENERLSADLAVETLRAHSTLDEPECDMIHAIILATKEHKVTEGEAEQVSVAVDIDMSILAAPWDDYRRYSDGVRREYCPMVTTESRFVAGRIMFLAGVLASARIFNSALGFERWERQARANVARELRELKAGQGIVWRAVSAAFGWTRRR